ILQESRDVKAIRDGVTKRVLSVLEELTGADDDAGKQKYATFWREFGQVLKEGLGEDFSNRERISKLLRFASTHTDSAEQGVSLADYLAGRAQQPVDEWMLSFLHEFDGKPLASVARGDLDLGALNDEEKKAQEKVGEDLKPLVDKMKDVLKDKAKDVRLTFRLTDSPSCLVADEGEMSGYLQRLLKAAGQKAPDFHPILEVNPEHALIKRLLPDATEFADWCHLLFDQALLAEGGALDDPANFIRRTNALLLSGAH
ncbi:hypothetical protein DFQ30_010215, partial [Apophysomyces sp. BC1015]